MDFESPDSGRLDLKRRPGEGTIFGLLSGIKAELSRISCPNHVRQITAPGDQSQVVTLSLLPPLQARSPKISR